MYILNDLICNLSGYERLYAQITVKELHGGLRPSIPTDFRHLSDARLPSGG